MGKKVVSHAIEETLKEAIEKKAREENRSISNMLEYIIKWYLKREEKKELLISEYDKKGYFDREDEAVDQKENAEVEKQEPEPLSEGNNKEDKEKDSILNHIRHSF